MIIAYARVSTNDQNLDAQLQAFDRYAQENQKEIRIFQEKESTRKKRPELQKALDMLRKGDTFIIYKLDRLARSTKELHEIADDLKERGVEFVSINDHIDTTTAAGRAMFGMLAVFAEFERSMIQERTVAGLQAARKSGRVGGRPTVTDGVKKQVRALYAAGETANDIAKEYGIGRSTIYKILNEEKEA